ANLGSTVTQNSNTVTWTGATSTDFGTASNWNPSFVPRTTDDVVIPNVGNLPATLDTNRTINSLNISQGGAALDMNNFNLTVSTYVTLVGTLTARGTEQISVGGDWTASGGLFNVAQSTITFNGGNQTLTGSATFYNLSKTV